MNLKTRVLYVCLYSFVTHNAPLHDVSIPQLEPWQTIQMENFVALINEFSTLLSQKNKEAINIVQTYAQLLIATSPASTQALITNMINQILSINPITHSITMHKTLPHTKHGQTKLSQKHVHWTPEQYQPLDSPKKIHGARKTMNRLKAKKKAQEIQKAKEQEERYQQRIAQKNNTKRLMNDNHIQGASRDIIPVHDEMASINTDNIFI